MCMVTIGYVGYFFQLTSFNDQYLTIQQDINDERWTLVLWCRQRSCRGAARQRSSWRSTFREGNWWPSSRQRTSWTKTTYSHTTRVCFHFFKITELIGLITDWLLTWFLPTPTELVGVGRMFGSVCVSVCLCVCLSVCLQHNSKKNDLRVFKLGIGHDFGISYGVVLGLKGQRSRSLGE